MSGGITSVERRVADRRLHTKDLLRTIRAQSLGWSDLQILAVIAVLREVLEHPAQTPSGANLTEAPAPASGGGCPPEVSA